MGLIERALERIGGSLRRGSRGGDEKPAETRSGIAIDGGRILVNGERLLSDEEHLLATVHTANGRVWQSTLCEKLGWDKSKVSRELARLEAKGEISKYRVGRRNAICLTEHEPDPAHFRPEHPVDESLSDRRDDDPHG